MKNTETLTSTALRRTFQTQKMKSSLK